MASTGPEYKARNPDYARAVLEGRQEAIENNRQNPNQAMMRAGVGGAGIGSAVGSIVGFLGGFARGGINKAGMVVPRAAAVGALLMGSFSAFDCNRARIKREAAA